VDTVVVTVDMEVMGITVDMVLMDMANLVEMEWFDL